MWISVTFFVSPCPFHSKYSPTPRACTPSTPPQSLPTPRTPPRACTSKYPPQEACNSKYPPKSLHSKYPPQLLAFQGITQPALLSRRMTNTAPPPLALKR
ncbi:hypothetical protein GDO86_009317 [Hymenochirus boettgeri]|uniref:Uncharacterized protein n=1 Tax=Hymenochirus boettgeri TaxID=247094 RepID=A0A8T2JFJ0_9PIPI|nr:hypothetical protein GDO86_009317 [Hymenochirus boettgeri]